nr:immunoglobulin heavy chain junction region [Macaca mulatta]MOX00826.1 immunoglobulin heavy chain junction region [Macaca mulatta]MOX02299.1 immunoglobulin heavy chain junction region [Macaca mulatta]MOX03202.1 immunoglobulin heavy chain junction region [Macaca mulatta]MOX04765.1 immunoglobulin heavy chain junction region [Macaca mulatta]
CAATSVPTYLAAESFQFW